MSLFKQTITRVLDVQSDPGKFFLFQEIILYDPTKFQENLGLSGLFSKNKLQAKFDDLVTTIVGVPCSGSRRIWASWKQENNRNHHTKNQRNPRQLFTTSKNGPKLKKH